MIGAVRPPPWTANGGRHGQVSMFETKNAQRGVYSAHRGKCRPSGCGRSARMNFHSRDKPFTGGVDSLWRPWTGKFPCSGRKPLRGAFIRSTGVDAAHRAVGGIHGRTSAFGTKAVHGRCGWRMAVDASFRVRDESRPEGRLFGPQG